MRSLNCIHQFCVSRRRDSDYKRKPFQDDYPEDFHELAALFMFSRRGSTWESSLPRSYISRLIYKADYWQRFLSSRNTDDSSRISRVNSFSSEKNEVCWNSWKRRNEYRIMNRWNVIPDGIIGKEEFKIKYRVICR